MRVSRCVCEARGVWRGFSNCEISRRAEASFKEMSSCFCTQRSACVLEWGCKFWFDPMIIFFLFISQECPNIAHLNFSPTVQKLKESNLCFMTTKSGDFSHFWNPNCCQLFYYVKGLWGDECLAFISALRDIWLSSLLFFFGFGIFHSCLV